MKYFRDFNDIFLQSVLKRAGLCTAIFNKMTS